MQEIVTFIITYKIALLNIAGLFALYALIELWAWLAYGPRDTTGNGITVGDAKAFDNRSLTLRIERLSSHLETLKVVNQNVADSINKIQTQTSTQSTREVSVDGKSNLSKAKEKEDSTNKQGDSNSAKSTTKTSSESTESRNKPSVELAASDVLSEQLNLASQILNLEMLYERSLTDRLYDDKTRLQTVLGFQVSITPPRGCEDAVAVVEIGVRMKDTKEPVSLVALIPQEKTYNSQTFSTSAYSIGGSAVTNVLSLGVNHKGETQQLFVHRDSDTIAFERDDQSRPSLFENSKNERVFGWEFRPVLGRRAVTPGTRQMLAVIALPVTDPEEAAQEPKEAAQASNETPQNSQQTGQASTGTTENSQQTGQVSTGTTENSQQTGQASTGTTENSQQTGQVSTGTTENSQQTGQALTGTTKNSKEPAQTKIILEIITRSYWRHFNRRKQTTGGKWGWFPLWIDSSMQVNSKPLDLPIPTTKQIQDALAPRVKSVKWVNSGGNRATVIVTGSNFFTGTKVVIGGVVHSEDDEDHKLILKSNQALEFETTMASLGKGDGVLSGRFGSSRQLLASLEAAKKRDIQALEMTQAVVRPSPFLEVVYLLVDVKAINGDAEDVDLEVSDIQNLPEPILFLGTESVPLPYDYYDKPAAASKDSDKNGNKPADRNDEEVEIEALESETEKPAVVAGEPSGSAEPIASQVIPGSAPGLETPQLSGNGAEGTPPPTASDKEPATIFAKKSTKKYVQVGAWIPKKLAASPSVTFRVPFCGLEYQASVPLTYSDPIVSVMGNDDSTCVFRIASPAGFKDPFRVELDKIYEYNKDPELERTSQFDYRFKVPIATAIRYRNLVVRTGEKELYLLPISVEDKPKLRATIVTSGKPPQIKKSSVGSLEWAGVALDSIKTVTLITKKPDPASKGVVDVRTALDFTVYDQGKKLEVYFGKTETETVGKAELEFSTEDQNILAPLFVTDKGDA